MNIVPNFRYRGQCEAAMRLYEKAFSGEITCLFRYSDANLQDYNAANWPEEKLQCIYHGEMKLSGQRFMFCDDFDHDTSPGQRIAFNFIFSEKSQAEAVFHAMLEAGSSVIVAPHATTYSPFMSAVADPFGVRWGILVE